MSTNSSTPRDLTDPVETARAMMREISDMLADGWTSSAGRPITAEAIVSGGFSAVHDYCDGNTLGGLCDEVADYYTEHGMRGDEADPDGGNDPWIQHGNTAQDIVDVWLRAGMPPLEGPEARYVSIASTCETCGETFNPMDVADLVHVERADGTPCNGIGNTLTTYATR
jgi:hypothetical protein